MRWHNLFYNVDLVHANERAKQMKKLKTYKTPNSIIVLDKITNIWINNSDLTKCIINLGTYSIELECVTPEKALEELKGLHQFLEDNL